MLIRYDGKTFDIEPPIENDNEIQIEVERFAEFPWIKSDVDQIFRFSHNIQKLLFFTIREGILPTWHKAKTALFQRKIIGGRSLILALGRLRGEDTYVAAVGPADCPASQVLIFPKQCVAELPMDADPMLIYSWLNEYFEKHPENLKALFYYDSLSGNDTPFSLKETLPKTLSGHPGSGCSELQCPPVGESIKAVQREYHPVNGHDLFLAGAGVYACISIIPYLPISRHTIIDKNPGLACAVRERFAFTHVDTSCERAFRRLVDVKKPVVVIATYHSTHLPLAELALSFNPEAKVMIEKPPVTTWEQLARLLALRQGGYFIEIGYNRRHTEYVRHARTLLDSKQGPTTVTCIVREKTIPMTHWYYWPTQGTRIIGNLTHWIDIGIHLIGSRPVSFNTMSSSLRFPADDVSISVHFEDGSQLNLIATDRGNPLRGIQEYIDIRKDDLTIKIDDFLHVTVQEGGRQRSSARFIRDKGHKQMYQDFLNKCLNGATASYPQIDLERTCGLYLSLKEALLRGERSGEITTLSSVCIADHGKCTEPSPNGR